MSRGRTVENGGTQKSSEPVSELETLLALNDREKRFYEELQHKYDIVVEQCRRCWKSRKHTTQKCLREKPICPRCGSDETHDREVCFLMCFRCGEVGVEASHESCQRRRVEILRQALMKKYALDAKTARHISKGKVPLPVLPE